MRPHLGLQVVRFLRGEVVPHNQILTPNLQDMVHLQAQQMQARFARWSNARPFRHQADE